MFTDQELDILEFEIFPIVNKFNDLQKVFENLDEDQVELFSKWCEYENIDTSEVTIGTFGKEENDILYLRGIHKNGYKEYRGGSYYRPWTRNIKSVITETKIILPKNCSDMFTGCEKLENLDASNGNVSKVEGMDSMFYGCGKLESIDVSNGDTSKVRNMGGMFYDCESLENLDVSNGDISKVKDMSWMFSMCEKLENLDVSNGNVSNVKDMRGMFNRCTGLENLDVSNGDVFKVEYMHVMFERCESLKELKGILNGNLRFSLNTNKMFDDTSNFKDKDKILKKFGVK